MVLRCKQVRKNPRWKKKVVEEIKERVEIK